jgi:hypothetical protein
MSDAQTPRRRKAERVMAGRPTIYTEEIGDIICARLADGESLNAICKDDEMPAESTVRSWAIVPEHPISAKYDRARELGYMKMADDLLEISDDGTNDWMVRAGQDAEGTAYSINGEHVSRSKLRVDTRKWLLSKALPKIYGDKIVNEHTGKDGKPIEVADVSDVEGARRVAYMLGLAMARKKNVPVPAS